MGWTCDYDTFLERKAAVLEAEEKTRAEFDRKLAQEEAWLRRGVKARRVRNQGRVQALMSLRRERAERRERQGVARLAAQEAERSGFKVVHCEDVSFQYGGRWILRDFSTRVERGDK